MTHGVSREGAAGATQRRRSCGFRSLRVVASSVSSEKCHALRHQSPGDFLSGLFLRLKFARGVAQAPFWQATKILLPRGRVRKPELPDKSLGLCRTTRRSTQKQSQSWTSTARKTDLDSLRSCGNNNTAYPNKQTDSVGLASAVQA